MFADRRDAGRQLADRLVGYATQRPIVVAMPRGGVPVAAAVADRLGAPLDIVVVRRIGCPWQPELGIGAIAEAGVRILNDSLIAEMDVRLRRSSGRPPASGSNWPDGFAVIAETVLRFPSRDGS